MPLIPLSAAIVLIVMLFIVPSLALTLLARSQPKLTPWLLAAVVFAWTNTLIAGTRLAHLLWGQA